MNADAPAIRRLGMRVQWPVSIGIALLWLIPMLFVLVIAIQERETTIARAWSQHWPYLYVISVSIWWWIPASWFQPRGWESSVYRALGIRTFKQFMVGGDRHNAAIRRHQPGYRSFASRSTRERLIYESIAAEKTHLIMFLFALWPSIVGALLGRWTYVAIVAGGNLFVNLYPIMLQRHTRARIQELQRPRNDA